MAVPVSELQKIAPSSIIELFELQLNVLQHGVNETYRFHAGASLNSNDDLVWGGNDYLRLPLEADGFEYSGNGQLPRPKIRVSNVLGTITAVLLTLPDGLEGAKVTRIRTLARYLDAVNFPGATNPFGTPDPTAEFPREIYYIDRKTAETRDVIEFELSAAFDMAGVRAPKRQCVASICQWKYRSAECGYTGTVYYKADDTPTLLASEDACGKRLSSCEARFSSFIRTGSVTSGSTTLTLSSTAGIGAGASGYPITGFGVPAGAIVSSITSATTLVMSAAATATSVVTVNGTPSATTNTMTVTSATGLGVGHVVTGSNIGTGTTISAIAGTTLTLSQRPYSIYRTGDFVFDVLSLTRYINISTSGLTSGMRVFGSNNINTTIATVGSGQITLNNYGDLDTENRSDIALYFMPASPSQSSYTFTGSSAYSLRSPNATLPFGSFPGVGTYFS